MILFPILLLFCFVLFLRSLHAAWLPFSLSPRASGKVEYTCWAHGYQGSRFHGNRNHVTGTHRDPRKLSLSNLNQIKRSLNFSCLFVFVLLLCFKKKYWCYFRRKSFFLFLQLSCWFILLKKGPSSILWSVLFRVEWKQDWNGKTFCLEGLSNGVRHEAFALFGTRAVFLLQYFVAKLKYQAKVWETSFLFCKDVLIADEKISGNSFETEF